MIILATAPLQLNSDCRQISCQFDKNLFQEQTAGELGLTLPTVLNSAVQKRKAEFIAGRYCARLALAQLGGNVDAPIGVGASRQPVWPEGFVGSITHTDGYASAMVARCDKVRAVGIDSEMWIEPGSLEDSCRQILTTGEIRPDNLHLFDSPLHYLTLVFSAKESLFKCLFPLVNRFFDFHAAVVIPQPSRSTTDGEFRFELLEDLNSEFRTGYSGHGRYSIGTDCVHTAVILNAHARENEMKN